MRHALSPMDCPWASSRCLEAVHPRVVLTPHVLLLVFLEAELW